MSKYDIPGFFLFGTIGFVSGLAAAQFFRHSRRPYLWTALISVPAATVLTFVLFFSLGVPVSMISHGDSFLEAVGEVLRNSIIVLLVAPFCCGAPAVISGLLSQWVMRAQKVST